MVPTTRRARPFALVLAALLFEPRAAFADDNSPSRLRNHWYGGEVLAVDAGALALTIGDTAASEQAVSYAGLGIHLLGPPVVHALHGRIGAGLGSLGLRVLGPTGAAAAGFGVGLLCGWVEAIAGGILGGTLGYLGAVSIDAAVLANEKVSPESTRAGLRLELAPTLGWTNGQRTVGLAGTF